MDSDLGEILGILDRILAIVRSGPQDLSWSGYADEAELLAEHSERLRRGDTSRLRDLDFLLATTGPVCEVAASSGWLETFTELGIRFDRLSARLRPSTGTA
ncbi:hypothetical protein [Nocardia transvalensis]|uniref:hypothetical protein n=1 Tax=Nocardia transvalensis TaxID=37333 RepID=UPI001894D0AE|nr:hypothetical protein [Nocardia transvalensis]MBF6327018.1 hypothetical protein [Nocardia transvalensis]